MPTLIVIGIFVLIIVILVLRSIKVVPQSKQLVVSRLGRAYAVHHSGLAILVPLIDRGKLIDTRGIIDLVAAKVPVNESEPVNINLTVAYHVIDALKATSNVADYKSAIATLSETQLRRDCAEGTINDLLIERVKTQERLRQAINVAAQDWGINVTEFTIDDVGIPESVQQEIKRKAEAERLRRLME